MGAWEHCLYDENKAWLCYELNTLETRYGREKFKYFKYSVERRVNSDFLVWFIFLKGLR